MRARRSAANKAFGAALLAFCFFYFLCASGIFFLPYDVLARSTFALWFVETALKIYPAVERAFSHTDFTQKAAFYIAYMGLVKLITLAGFLGSFLLSKTSKTEMVKRMRKDGAIKRFFVAIFGVLMTIFFAYLDFGGRYIGYRRPKGYPEYEWVLTTPGELFWQMSLDFCLVVFTAACALYVFMEILIIFKRKSS